MVIEEDSECELAAVSESVGEAGVAEGIILKVSGQVDGLLKQR